MVGTIENLNFEDKRNWLKKLLLSSVCVYLFREQLKMGFFDGCSWVNHIMYIFCHANIWHLAGNILVLFCIRGKIEMLPSLVIAVIASYLPMYVVEPTIGISGFIFAVFGIMWGELGWWKKAITVVGPYIIIPMVIPNVNGLLHLYCFLLGYIYASVRKLI